MDQVDPLRRERFSKWARRRAWQVASITLTGLSVVLAMTAAFCLFSLLLAKVLLQLRRDQRNAASVIQTREHEFHQMASNIQEQYPGGLLDD